MTPVFPTSLDRQIEKLSRHDCPVIVTGETGTGKEVVVRELHRRSARSRHAMISLNCAAIPAGLLETELFGHARGAFTGAIADAPGKIREADRGILFLDEIGDLDAQSQAKLLRVVETKEVMAVGDRRGRRCDVRFVAATNRDISPEARGPLRDDLFYRLCVGHIHVPPLRGSRARIRRLIALFVADNNHRQNRQVGGFDADASDLLLSYDWPGNVRELRNLIEATFVNADGPVFGVGDIPPYHAARLSGTGDGPRADAARLLAALKATNGNKTQAARHLRWSRATLYRRLRELREKGADPALQSA